LFLKKGSEDKIALGYGNLSYIFSRALRKCLFIAVGGKDSVLNKQGSNAVWIKTRSGLKLVSSTKDSKAGTKAL
jgi:hypothetical protein